MRDSPTSCTKKDSLRSVGPRSRRPAPRYSGRSGHRRASRIPRTKTRCTSSTLSPTTPSTQCPSQPCRQCTTTASSRATPSAVTMSRHKACSTNSLPSASTMTTSCALLKKTVSRSSRFHGPTSSPPFIKHSTRRQEVERHEGTFPHHRVRRRHANYRWHRSRHGCPQCDDYVDRCRRTQEPGQQGPEPVGPRRRGARSDPAWLARLAEQFAAVHP